MDVTICAKRQFAWSEKPDDLMMPSPPQPPFFDRTRGTWVLSRYRDVVEALRDPKLLAAGAGTTGGTETSQLTIAEIRASTFAALASRQFSEWRPKFESLAHTNVMALPSDRPVDLISEFAEPWCTELAFAITGGASAPHRKRLVELARRVSACAADPEDRDLKSAALVAESELKQSFPAPRIPAPDTVFVAVAQTLPGFLANAWLALFRHPSELSRVQANPELMPAAIEELLRYAGLARKVVRIAKAARVLGGSSIAAGQRLTLALNSANRDPEQFVEPNRLDLTRRAVGHLALGEGQHACVGAALIRMASIAATSAFVQKFYTAAVCEPIEWRGGSGFRAPAVLLARIRQPAA